MEETLGEEIHKEIPSPGMARWAAGVVKKTEINNNAIQEDRNAAIKCDILTFGWASSPRMNKSISVN